MRCYYTLNEESAEVIMNAVGCLISHSKLKSNELYDFKQLYKLFLSLNNMFVLEEKPSYTELSNFVEKEDYTEFLQQSLSDRKIRCCENYELAEQICRSLAYYSAFCEYKGYGSLMEKIDSLLEYHNQAKRILEWEDSDVLEWDDCDAIEWDDCDELFS